jgi:hypothetical protein
MRPHSESRLSSSRADRSQRTTSHHASPSLSIKSHHCDSHHLSRACSHKPYHTSLGTSFASRYLCHCRHGSPSVGSSHSRWSHQSRRSPSPAGRDALPQTSPTLPSHWSIPHNSSSTGSVFAPLFSLEAPHPLSDSFQETIHRNIINSHVPHKLFTLPSREIGPYVPDHTLALLTNSVCSPLYLIFLFSPHI